MERSLAEFERSLPQMFFLVYLGPLPVEVPPAAFGFWLLNQAAVPELDAWRANERGILLTVDTSRRSAALTAGYFVENHLGAEDLDAVLRGGRAALRAGEPEKAVARMTGMLIRLLRARSRALEREGLAAEAPRYSSPENPIVFQLMEPLRGPTPNLSDADALSVVREAVEETPTAGNTDGVIKDENEQEAAAAFREPRPEDVFAEEWEIARDFDSEPESLVSAPAEAMPEAEAETEPALPAGESPTKPEPEPETVAGMVKKRAKSKSRQHRNRRG